MPATRHITKKKKGNQYNFEFTSKYVPVDTFQEVVGRFDERLRKLETRVDWTEEKADLNLPKHILEKLPKEVRKTVEGVESNYQNDYADFCFWGMRRALIDAIRIRFQKDGKEKMLYDDDRRPYSLPKWIELSKQESYISSTCAKNLRDQVRVFGDTASHDYMADLKKEEVPSIFTQLRFALARMYYEKEQDTE